MKKIFLLLPSSLLEDCSDLDAKTIKIGFIARAAAIFKVSEIIIYSTGETGAKSNGKFLKLIFDYIDCPQYLRKHLFPLSDELKSVGRLPPLEAPHHVRFVKSSEIRSGSIRQGVVVRVSEGKSYVYAGLDELVPVYDNHLRLNDKINLKILVNSKGLHGVVVDKIDGYWGYKTLFFNKPLVKLLEKRPAEVVVATSKYGENISSLLDVFETNFKNKNSIALVFGSPKRGLFQIIDDERLMKELFDYIVNFIPAQGTRTVRTEEAIYSTLSIINALLLK
ncbi:MAG: methylase [Candidatus Odinarchaeum yellowstonii]|uniref:Methylase n=1 Tax=Odinarchaeota yellowstonii (strain LCB_4) TaxID=1841599 RepID=A0AAF0D3G8_ODILC|nr:MAG: methylase [Candidatus Odinarchaeum yellowstonii]